MQFDLDHVAVAAETTQELWQRYAGDLSGKFVAFGVNSGFRSGQVQFANGMKVEVLEPFEPHNNDFLRRFIDSNGAGPHHLTFKVTPTIDKAIERAIQLGFPVVGINTAFPEWQEVFIHPRGAHGIVVQIACTGTGDDDWGIDKPAPFPTAVLDQPVDFQTVVHAVADLDGALRLFCDLLGGVVTGRSTGFSLWDGDAAVAELAWPGPGRITLIQPSSDSTLLGQWLGSRPGRLHHLAFAHPSPATARDANPLSDGTYEVAPEHNLGVRLILR